MKNIDDLLLLGDPRLYEVSAPVEKVDLIYVSQWAADLHQVMHDIRQRYGFGRGIAAPQLGIMKRMVYIHIDTPLILLNPVITYAGDEKFELWDDCMSFPNLFVYVSRHKDIEISYKDEKWSDQTLKASGALSELLQHEIDHLDGILCIDRAIGERAFKWRK